MARDDLGVTKKLASSGKWSISGTTNLGLAMEDELESIFTPVTNVREPILPAQTQLLSWHIIQKRARQLLDDNRFFWIQQALWVTLCCIMFLIPNSEGPSGWGYVADTFMMIGLIFSCAELSLYTIGHGFFPSGMRSHRSSKWQRIQAVLSVWSPPRFRRRRDDQTFLVKVPLWSNSLLRIELTLVVISVIGYLLPFSIGFHRAKYLHGLRSMRLLFGLATIWTQLLVFAMVLLDCITALSPAFLMLAFFLILFGVAGIDQFGGSLSRRCVMVHPSYQFEATDLRNVCLGLGRPVVDDCVESTPPMTCSLDASDVSFSTPTVCRGQMVCASWTLQTTVLPALTIFSPRCFL
jgi:hypothetical protein